MQLEMTFTPRKEMSTSGKMDLREATKNIRSRNNRVDKQQNPIV